ncbi:MAG: guanylate kinase [Endomicrobium sp.]|jgi:guanylate kinase|nr:guanylate kinase [Endomicrobium sp.]
MDKKITLSCVSSLGNLIVISAPSGTGKTTVCDFIINRNKDIVSSISYTTRMPRQNEKNGRDYFFISKSEFQKMKHQKEFIEYTKIYGNYYGTSKKKLKNILKTNKNVILKIDGKGGVNIKKQYSHTCTIFMITPNLKILKERLIIRNEDNKRKIKTRLNNAKKEFEYIKQYEYLVVNKELINTVYIIQTIIKSLEYKNKSDQNIFDFWTDGFIRGVK